MERGFRVDKELFFSAVVASSELVDGVAVRLWLGALYR